MIKDLEATGIGITLGITVFLLVNVALGQAILPGARRTTPHRGATKRATASGRRSAEEMAELGERLHDAVRANLGEGMTVLMAEVGGTSRDLQRPMMLLKRAGRVRSVGQRHQTRYFPMAESA